jgi:ATP-dependent Clp protease ATP-binding subunit ClpB
MLVDENVTPFILKLNVNVPLFIQILNSTIQSFPKVTGGEVMLEKQYLKRWQKHCKKNE